MLAITKYQALDGSVFNTEKECLDCDKLIRKVKKIMAEFPDPPKDMGLQFANGGGYIQHQSKYVDIARDEITKLGNKLFNINPPTSFGWIGRYFDDSGKKCLYSAWQRLLCIDIYSREWGQAYYAINPTAGKQEVYKE